MAAAGEDVSRGRSPMHVEAATDAIGERLDAYLARTLPRTSRSQVQGWIRDGRVRIDGVPARANRRLRGGEGIEVTPPAPEPSALEPADIPVDVLHRDEDLLVLVKPAGLVVHPGAGTRRPTLVHALLGMGETLSGVGGPERPGIVHRLDRDTSGLLLVARNDEAHRRLSHAFRAREIRKEYRAVCWGVPRDREGIIDLPLGRDPVHRTRMSSRGRKQRPARTRYRTLESYPGFALLDLLLETGRTHQIRAHLRSLGHPVVGDRDYGGAGWRKVRDEALRDALRGFGRLALHAYRLGLRHPTTGAALEFTAPLPAAFAALLDALARSRGGA